MSNDNKTINNTLTAAHAGAVEYIKQNGIDDGRDWVFRLVAAVLTFDDSIKEKPYDVADQIAMIGAAVSCLSLVCALRGIDLKACFEVFAGDPIEILTVVKTELDKSAYMKIHFNELN